ncbi:hypothetical protein BFP97_03235 [Roseivirga sp. 4D4]|uniref:hypothetical protein n=1 Tax=Roseivirga sp. 4D4 TaxID=1889784 RepID=UPI000852D6DC|nr:hypothetical protein [Roseivirga sp. 4D4]OEK00578.1 hypothetical protein BFP97_03235 [Roseivirga sp. 4D4]
MVKLFMLGEPLYMSILTVLLLLILFLSGYTLHRISFGFQRISNRESRIALIKGLGLFSIIFGMFTQFLGLYGALETIEIWGEVESNILFQGIRISFIPMGYGVIIFLLSKGLTSKSLHTTQVLS